MLSSTVIVGRLVRDPELRYTPSGVAVCGFTLACDRDYADGQGNRETDFYDCVAWRKTAETIANNLAKGRQIGVYGRFQSRTYDAKDGGRRKVWELQVDRFWFLDSRKDSSSDLGEEVEDEEVPF